MRGKRLAKNAIASLLFQGTTILCGFILPRLILEQYGSSVNGLVNSITQFLHIISFLELGVGAVVQSSLYKPLAEKNRAQISKIIASADKFFKRLAFILLVYVIALMVIYPYIAEQDYGVLYTATLIVAMSISSFAQYYFGVVDRLLLIADQKGYIQYNAQTITVILNTAACVILIRIGASIRIVKLITSLIYVIRPLVLRWYVNKHYDIDRRIKYEIEPIKQKWNGVAQHVSSFVLDGTDSIILTTFSTLNAVSVYSVYHMVISGVFQIIVTVNSNVTALMGELIARGERKNLEKSFAMMEWIIHTGAVFVFGCMSLLLVPFVEVYTAGINDADYIQPVFALVLVLAYGIRCLRLPYNVLILAAGHYKQTQNNYVIAVILNIVLSLLTVKAWGLVGVAFGTLAAMLYQTIWMMKYVYKHIINIPMSRCIIQFGIDLLVIAIAYPLAALFKMASIGIGVWIITAFKAAFIWLLVILFVNLVFNRTFVMKAFKR